MSEKPAPTRTRGVSRGAQPSFELEEDLCEILSASVLQALHVSKPVTFLGEVQVGLVIPDLVFVCAGTARTQPAVGLTGFDSWIIAELLRGRSRRTETLAARLFARPEKTIKALERLERRGAVRRESSECFSLCAGWFPRESEVVAVEAKLVRWREAVDQATEYLRFANRSYVALPEETVARTTAIAAACRMRGLGLVSVSRRGVDVVHRAPLHRPRSASWVWLVGRALSQDRSTDSMRPRERCAKPVGGQASSGRESRQAPRP